jgi:class 3 adenylate cyclase
MRNLGRLTHEQATRGRLTIERLTLNRLTIKSKLQLMLLAVSLASILVIGYVGWSRARAALQGAIFNQLTSLRSSKAYQLESYFKNLRNHVETLCEDRMVVTAMVEFKKGFKQLNQEYIPVDWNNPLEAYYKKEFFTRLPKNIPGKPDFQTYRPASQAARYLQYHYIVKNPHSVGKKDELIDALDKSEYSQIHEEYHPLFRNLIKKFGYYDFFLIDYKTGDIVYTVYKETDFATSLNDGPYRKTNLAEVVASVRENPERGAIQLVDFKPYRPSYMTPSAFLAGPIYNGPHIVGILAIQLPVDEVNKVLTGNRNWKQDGLGKTGETYLVGADLLMRSVSRFLIEDKKGYLAALRAKGTPDSNIQLIDQLNTSILLQKVDTDAAKKAIGGTTGTQIGKDYRGRTVLSSYSPIRIEGVDWAILAEKDLSEAYQPVYTLQTYLIISTVILILLISFTAGSATSRFVKPIKAMIESSRQVSAGELDTEVSLNSQDEFGELAELFNEMIKRIRKQQQLLEQRSHETEVLLLNILPKPVADRVRKGEEQIADHVQQVTVLFASIAGFAELATQRKIEEVAKILNELIDSFDEEAEKHDVEKIKTIGERYMAVCGLTAPRLDHTKRIMDFALQALEIVQGFNNKYSTKLSLRVGIHRGAATAGIVGNKKFSYDLWGETVNIVFQLERQAESNAIVVTQNVYDRVQDLYNFERGKDTQVEGSGKLITWVLRKKWIQNLFAELAIGDFDDFDLDDDIDEEETAEDIKSVDKDSQDDKDASKSNIKNLIGEFDLKPIEDELDF